jgi:DNA-binding protein HU-beta
MILSLVEVMTEQWQNNDSILIQNFGSFEIKKKLERISVNPVTKQRLLVPPKLVLTFRPSNVLKDKFK